MYIQKHEKSRIFGESPEEEKKEEEEEEEKKVTFRVSLRELKINNLDGRPQINPEQKGQNHDEMQT